MNPADPKTDTRVLQVTGGGWQALDWSPDDTRLLVVEYTSITKSTLWLADVAGGQKTALTNPAEDVAYGAGLFSADGRGVWYLMARDEGHGFAKKGNADFQFYATVMFVRRFLLDQTESSSDQP